MKLSERAIVATLLVVAAIVGLQMIGRPATVVSAPDTVYLKMSERSAAIADTVTKTVTMTRSFRDTLNIYDTVQVKEFVTRVDTLIIRCEQCAAQLREHRRVSDSVVHARDDTITHLRARLASCKGRRPWWALGGLTAGVLACGR